MKRTCGVILAAGDGKRMGSARSKVLCQVLFKPMLTWVVESCQRAGIGALCAVISDQGEDVAVLLPADCATAVQKQRLGTGHAMCMAGDFLRLHPEDDVLMLYGDAPFVDEETIQGALEHHRATGAALTVISAQVEHPKGYGRILRSEQGLQAIVEEQDATEEQRAIQEINSGVMWFQCEFLLKALQNLEPNNVQEEYYITDAVAIAVQMGLRAESYVAASADVVQGANDRKALAHLNQLARDRVLDRLYCAGVDIPLKDGILVGPDVIVGPDTTLLPGTILKGKTIIGSGCTIGPNTTVEDSIIGDGVVLDQTVVEQSTVGDSCKMGPFTHLRPGCIVGQGVKVGNFVELKNTTIGANTSVAHLTYLGDSDLGVGVNVGCGVVTANYDGAKKYRTIIGDGVFIGCNTNLIAPVTVGDGANIAAGTTVTQTVPAQALAIGRVRQENKENWAAQKGKYKKR